MNKKVISIIGIVTTIVGAGLTLLSDWANDKKMEEKIEEKVNEALAEKSK